MYRDCVRVADALTPQTRAYYSIWIDGFQLKTDDPFNQSFVDPLYGKTYLPRKFKVAFAIPPVNDTDIYTNCLGLVAMVENDELLGYNLVVGGGMGRSNGNKATYPRLASELGKVVPGLDEGLLREIVGKRRIASGEPAQLQAHLALVLAHELRKGAAVARAGKRAQGGLLCFISLHALSLAGCSLLRGRSRWLGLLQLPGRQLRQSNRQRNRANAPIVAPAGEEEDDETDPQADQC